MKGKAIGSKKTYIITAIILIMALSVGVSFCMWDTTSLSKLMSGGVSDYKMYDIVDDRFSDDNGTVGKNNVANVGDIVTYGRYYQSASNDKKTPLRWIVVHKENKELTLLTEDIVASGAVYNAFMYYTDGRNGYNDPYYAQSQNYMISTLSMWLNSEYSARDDRLESFSKDHERVVMRGFMNEAFNPAEVADIKTKTISGIKGYNYEINSELASDVIQDFGEKSYKVWTLSFSEICGANALFNGVKIQDGLPNKRFDYFKNTDPLKDSPEYYSRATEFAFSPEKSFFSSSVDVSNVAPGIQGVWLRSPDTSRTAERVMLLGHVPGSIGSAHTPMGVRPAISISV